MQSDCTNYFSIYLYPNEMVSHNMDFLPDGTAALSCSDASNQCEDTVPKIETAQAHEHNQDSDDNCSPFAIAVVAV